MIDTIGVVGQKKTACISPSRVVLESSNGGVNAHAMTFIQTHRLPYGFT